MSKVSEDAKKMVRHYVGVENAQISAFGDVWHIEGDRDNAEELAQHILDLQHKCDALAAENAALKAINIDRRVFIMNGVQLGYIKVPTVETDPALETIRIAVSPQEPTPATDAYLNSVRAEGVELVKEHPAVSLCSLTHVCEEIAAQLRAGKDGE